MAPSHHIGLRRDVLSSERPFPNTLIVFDVLLLHQSPLLACITIHNYLTKQSPLTQVS